MGNKLNAENKHGNGKYYAALVVLAALLIYFLGIFDARDTKISGENSSKSIYKEYGNLSDLLASTNMDIDIPEYVCEQEDLRYFGYNNQIIRIENNDICFMSAYFVNNLADNLGIYDDCDIDNRYNLREGEDNKVRFIRYRAGFSEYPGKVIIDWNDGQIQYAIMMVDTFAEESMNKIGLNISQYDIIESQKEALDLLEKDYSRKWDTPVVCRVQGRNIKIDVPDDGNIYRANLVKLVNDGWEIDVLIDSDIVFIISNTNFEGSSMPTAINGANLYYSEKVISVYGLDSSDMVRIAASLVLEEEHNENGEDS